MAISVTYPHIDLLNPAYAQANATTSTALQTQLADDHRAGAWIADTPDSVRRAATVHYRSQLGKWQIRKKTQGAVTTTFAQALFDTAADACDAAAVFVDSEGTPS